MKLLSKPAVQLVLPGMEKLFAKCGCPLVWDLWNNDGPYILHVMQTCRGRGVKVYG